MPLTVSREDSASEVEVAVHVYQRVRQYSLCRDDPGEKWRPYSISTLVLC